MWSLSDEGLLTCKAAGNSKRECVRCLTVQRNGKLVLTMDGHGKAKCQRWRLVRCVSPATAHTTKQARHWASLCSTAGGGEDSICTLTELAFFLPSSASVG